MLYEPNCKTCNRQSVYLIWYTHKLTICGGKHFYRYCGLSCNLQIEEEIIGSGKAGLVGPGYIKCILSASDERNKNVMPIAKPYELTTEYNGLISSWTGHKEVSLGPCWGKGEGVWQWFLICYRWFFILWHLGPLVWIYVPMQSAPKFYQQSSRSVSLSLNNLGLYISGSINDSFNDCSYGHLIT